MIDPGPIGLAQHDTVVITLVPGLEIDATDAVPAGLNQPKHITVEMNSRVEFDHPHLNMSGPQNACHCHLPLLVPGCARAAAASFRPVPDKVFAARSVRSAGPMFNCRLPTGRRVMISRNFGSRPVLQNGYFG